MPVIRWTLHDPVESETMTFPINPSEGGTPEYSKTINEISSIAGRNGTIFYEGADVPKVLEFSGVILTQDHLELFVEWSEKRRVLRLTDDLGREFDVYIETFAPKRVRRATRPYYHTYTMRCVVMR